MATETNVTVENREGTARSLRVEVPAERVGAEFQKAYESVRRNARIKGFRQGKAPLSLIKGMYGEQVRNQVMEELVSETYPKALTDHALTPINAPNFDSGDLREGEPFAYTATFDVRPDVTLANYTGLTVEVEVEKVEDKNVDEALGRLRESRAKAVPLLEDRPAAAGDVVTIDFVGRRDGRPIPKAAGQDFVFELGREALIADLEAGVAGMKPGESREIDVAFPEDYHDEGLRGAKATFSVTLKLLQRKEFPELTDEFAQSLGAEFPTLEALRNRVRDDLEKAAEAAKQRAIRQAILDKVLESNEIPATEAMVAAELEHMAHDYKHELERQGIDMKGKRIDMERFRAEREAEAIRAVKVKLAVEEVADQEGLSVGEQDLRDRCAELARGTGRSPEQVQAAISKGGHLGDLRASVLERKVLEFLTVANSIREIDKAS
ncbi:MAG: trigger factor [Myxococcales bacterium]|nr:trigger factor [Myxococcales bacterium]